MLDGGLENADATINSHQNGMLDGGLENADATINLCLCGHGGSKIGKIFADVAFKYAAFNS